MNKEILKQADKFLQELQEDGMHDTFLDDVKLYKRSTYDKSSPLLYDFCLILVLQGKKIGHLSDNVFEYDANNYLVVPTTIPLECETIASQNKPFICLTISINKKVINEIMDLISKKEVIENEKNSLGIFSDKVTPQIEELTLKLLKVLESQEEAMILGNSVLKELFYRIAMGENSNFLHKMFLKSNNEAKIAQAIKNIHDDLATHLEMSNLARKVDMSVSSFHSHFKKITSHTPLQYIKKIRLNKAKDLITKQNYQVNDAAFEVGYESASQFSRDFKSYFGYPPKEAKPSFG